MLKALKPFGAAAVALSLAGCSSYLDRRDTLLLGAGEAVQTNIVTHQIDPWPAHARDLYVDTNGERVQHAIESYRNRQAGPGAFQGSQTGGALSAASPSAGTAPVR